MTTTLSTPAASPKQWPPVEVLELAADDRRKALAIGIESLAAVIAVEESKISALKGLLVTANRVAAGAVVSDEAIAEALAFGLEVIDRHYAPKDCEQTEAGEQLGTVATEAREQLGLLTGHTVLARGGRLDDDRLPRRATYVQSEIARFGHVGGGLPG